LKRLASEISWLRQWSRIDPWTINFCERETLVIRRLFDLSGRVALVTGGSKGLGKAMARGLAEAGADIVISSRHEDELQAAAGAIGAGLDVRVKYIVADMSSRAEAKRLATLATGAMGKVDILINNAGTNKPQPIDQIDDDLWNELLELNLSSCMALTRALAPGMKERKWGRVIHISSIMGHSSAAGRNAYSATKSALLGLARASANDLGPFGVTVNCIAPGPFLTDLPVSLLSKEQRDEFARRTALGRWGQPEELIGPALLLASDAGSYITGTCLTVDGGCLSKIF
jgi:NAD(P)-dependent dehydrogenase (short-subunit alcohol dehydrogenase family)